MVNYLLCVLSFLVLILAVGSLSVLFLYLGIRKKSAKEYEKEEEKHVRKLFFGTRRLPGLADFQDSDFKDSQTCLLVQKKQIFPDL